jgi:hypothetical protein
MWFDGYSILLGDGFNIVYWWGDCELKLGVVKSENKIDK